ncbi:mitochondrial matrix Mmp37 [Neoconidiobolus thromboides FSU 785]|nr:mitochondrial matrix Mmp37 [Neoconidiobolus thromboides FSU 785]
MNLAFKKLISITKTPILTSTYEFQKVGFIRFNSTKKDVKLEVNSELDTILSHFDAPIRFACGYGSGVFKQLGYSSNDLPQVDLIFGVTHPAHWHSENFRKNRHHYSGMSKLGSGFVSMVQDNFGAGIYYNPYCKIGNLKVKYGVISIEKLVNDLVHWDTLYLAGRMQKPLKILKDDPHVKIANQINRSHALRASLLMLPKTFTIEELFTVLVSISYMGDFRMIVGENPKKVQNIVKAQHQFLEEIYHPVIDAFPNLSRNGDIIEQVYDDEMTNKIAKKLPVKLRKVLKNEYIIATRAPMNTEVEYKRSSDMKKATEQALSNIVKESALTQSVKGLFTAGITRSIWYIKEKLSKMFRK